MFSYNWDIGVAQMPDTNRSSLILIYQLVQSQLSLYRWPTCSFVWTESKSFFAVFLASFCVKGVI